EPAARPAHEEEADHLEDAISVPGVDVADVAELAVEPAARARLLLDLADGGCRGILAWPDPALRQRPDSRRLPARPDRRDVPAATHPPDQHAPGRELPSHRFEPIGSRRI